MREDKPEWSSDVSAGAESLLTDLALVLSIAIIIVVYEMMTSIA